jgi:hypothetical protein
VPIRFELVAIDDDSVVESRSTGKPSRELPLHVRPLSASSERRRARISRRWRSRGARRAGPARDQFDRTELDKRLIVMAGCYDSEKHRIIDEQPGDDGKRVLRVELTKGTVTKTPRFTTVKGPSDRWYVEDADFAAVTALCKR